MNIRDLNLGDVLPEREHCPSNVSLFLYNAAVWNPHRIHYDETYTKDQEGHSEIVIDGPLQGDWLAQCVANWVGDFGEMKRFSYSNRRATYLGETLCSGGEIVAIDEGNKTIRVKLWVKNSEGEVTTPGEAEVLLFQ